MYKNYLLNKFGRADLKGLDVIGIILDNYDIEQLDLGYIYIDIATGYGSTPTAVERCVRYYIQSVIKTHTIQKVAEVLNYQLRPEQRTFTIKEFLSLIKTRATE